MIIWTKTWNGTNSFKMEPDKKYMDEINGVAWMSADFSFFDFHNFSSSALLILDSTLYQFLTENNVAILK